MLRWRKRRTPFPERPDDRFYYTLRTPVGNVMVANYPDGWLASMNFDGSDDDPALGRYRKTPEAAQRDAERWLHRVATNLIRMLETPTT